MSLDEQIQDWKRQLEQASEYGLFFDKATVRDMLEVIEGQQNEINFLREITGNGE